MAAYDDPVSFPMGGLPQPIMTASTEAVVPGTDDPITVKIGQIEENVPRLSKEEFRRVSQAQKAKDAARAVGPELQSQSLPPVPFRTSLVGGKRSKGRPRTCFQTPRPSVPPAISKVVADQSALTERVARMELAQDRLARGIDRVIGLIANSHATPPVAAVPVSTSPTLRFVPPPPIEMQLDKESGEWTASDALESLSEHAAALEEDECLLGDNVQAQVDDQDLEVERLRKFVLGKPALREWRRFWTSLCPRAAYQEWSLTMQAKFDTLFNTIVTHPLFLSQTIRLVRTFRNGSVVGDEQFYRMLLVIAGSCSLYRLITSCDED